MASTPVVEKLENLTVRDRAFTMPLLALGVIVQTIWVLEFNLIPLFILSMIFIMPFEAIWERGRNNFSRWDEFIPMDDYRLYISAIILNPILVSLVVFRGYLSYPHQFVGIFFGVFVAILDFISIGRLLADALYLKRRTQLST